MARSGEYLRSTPLQFPQPTRPLHADDTNIKFKAAVNRLSEDNFSDFEENWTAESGVGSRVHDHDYTTQILRGFVDELDEKGHEMFKKLVSKVENDVPIERLFRQTLHDFRGRPVSASEVLEKLHKKLNSGGVKDGKTMQRDLNGDISMSEGQEMEHKLERFKVKTVNVAGVGVVREEKN